MASGPAEFMTCIICGSIFPKERIVKKRPLCPITLNPRCQEIYNNAHRLFLKRLTESKILARHPVITNAKRRMKRLKMLEGDEFYFKALDFIGFLEGKFEEIENTKVELK